jgi:hypothetical protein
MEMMIIVKIYHFHPCPVTAVPAVSSNFSWHCLSEGRVYEQRNA